jgi:hypothetical protein
MIPATMIGLVGLVLVLFGIATICVEAYLRFLDRAAYAQTGLLRTGIVMAALGVGLTLAAGLSHLLGVSPA